MYLEAKVSEVIQWAEEVAGNQKTSALSVLIAFEKFYKQEKNIEKAKKYVERAS